MSHDDDAAGTNLDVRLAGVVLADVVAVKLQACQIDAVALVDAGDLFATAHGRLRVQLQPVLIAQGLGKVIT